MGRKAGFNEWEKPKKCPERKARKRKEPVLPISLHYEMVAADVKN